MSLARDVLYQILTRKSNDRGAAVQSKKLTRFANNPVWLLSFRGFLRRGGLENEGRGVGVFVGGQGGVSAVILGGGRVGRRKKAEFWSACSRRLSARGQAEVTIECIIR